MTQWAAESIDMKTAATLDRVHNARSHRLDAKAIAPLFGVNLRTFATMIGANANTVRTRSDSVSLQGTLKDAVVTYDTLSEMFPLDETIARWMHHPLRSLDGKRTPIELAEREGIGALRELVESMFAGNYQ